MCSKVADSRSTVNGGEKDGVRVGCVTTSDGAHTHTHLVGFLVVALTMMKITAATAAMPTNPAMGKTMA